MYPTYLNMDDMSNVDEIHFFLKVPKFSGHGVKALVVDCVTSSTGSPDNLGTYCNALFKNSFGDFFKCSKAH